MTDYFTIFEDRNFKGIQYTKILDNVSDGQLYSLKQTPIHDKMSSVKWQLSGNKKVIFYENSEGTGRQYTITGSGSDPDTHDDNFEDCASSWRLIEGNSIPLAFSKIPVHPVKLRFSCSGLTMPSGGHMQGIQQSDNRHLVISGSSGNAAYFIIIRWSKSVQPGEIGKVIKVVRINDDFPGMKHNHASGIQLYNNILVVGTEGGGDAVKSSVVFYDLSDVNNPRVVGKRIDRTWDTAGAAGIVKYTSGYLLSIGGWDSDNIDFYISNNTTINSNGCRFTRVKTWRKSNKDTSGWIDENWGAYQSLNLLKESKDRLYLVGFNRNEDGHDWADLYSLDLNAEESRMLKKIDKKHIYCEDGASFRFGSGIYAPDPALRISLLAVEAYYHTEITINYF